MIRAFLEAYPSYDASNFIASSAEVIGDVTLGEQASIWFNATVRGDVNWVRIGEASNVQDNAVVHVSNGTAPTDIGAYVTIGHSAVVHGCIVEDNVLIGMGAVVLDHAIIGRDSIVGAKALVTGGMEVPPRSLVLGVPGTVVRTLSDDEVTNVWKYAERYLRYSAIYRGQEQPETSPFYAADEPRQHPAR